MHATLTSLDAALAAQSEAMLQIQHVHRMAPAFGAAMVEIARRREFSAFFLSRYTPQPFPCLTFCRARDMADMLAKVRGLEERRRDNFSGEIIRYLPPALTAGLEDKPPSCEVSVSNTKDGLPALSRDDVAGMQTAQVFIYSV